MKEKGLFLIILLFMIGLKHETDLFKIFLVFFDKHDVFQSILALKHFDNLSAILKYQNEKPLGGLVQTKTNRSDQLTRNFYRHFA